MTPRIKEISQFCTATIRAAVYHAVGAHLTDSVDWDTISSSVDRAVCDAYREAELDAGDAYMRADQQRHGDLMRTLSRVAQGPECGDCHGRGRDPLDPASTTCEGCAGPVTT